MYKEKERFYITHDGDITEIDKQQLPSFALIILGAIIFTVTWYIKNNSHI